jgi:hypothetical protein
MNLDSGNSKTKTFSPQTGVVTDKTSKFISPIVESKNHFI